MLTPSIYWRIASELDAQTATPAAHYMLPESMARQTRPPHAGDGLVLAAYDEATQTGLIRHLGLLKTGRGTEVEVEWRAVEAEIWIDTAKGRAFWMDRPGFRFADKKIAGYGLHELFAACFDVLVARELSPLQTSRVGQRSSGRSPLASGRGQVAPERLNPIEEVGAPTSSSRCGVVYVLKSAYGYKVGRTRNVPARVRAFGVHLPIIYTIPLCTWFDDCVDAEQRYHRMFRDKRINGEWF